MTTATGKLVIIDLGSGNVQYFWNGVLLEGVISIFVYRGVTLSMKVRDKTLLPTEEMKLNGIKVREIK